MHTLFAFSPAEKVPTNEAHVELICFFNYKKAHMKCLVIDGPARGQKLDLNTNSLSYVVDHAHGSGPGGYQPHRYEPTDLTPEAAQRGFTIALAYAGIEPA